MYTVNIPISQIGREKVDLKINGLALETVSLLSVRLSPFNLFYNLKNRIEPLKSIRKKTSFKKMLDLLKQPL